MKTIQGMSREEVKRLSFPSLKGEKVIYRGFSSATMTHNRVYEVINHFCYLNRKYDLQENEQWWEWDQFITLKNDYGWTVKMNVASFTSLKQIQARKAKVDTHYDDPLNVLWEAHEMQKAVS